MNIRYVQHNSIDKARWDSCIDSSDNGLIYAYAQYLDTMCGPWDALLLNDYEYVMPLPWRKKYGIYYVYGPAYIAELGLFGKNITPELLELFLQSIPKKFKFLDFPLNYGNLFATSFPLFQRVNFVLDLNKPYEVLHKQYRENIRRNIKKAKGYGCFVKRDIAVIEVIALSKLTATQFNIASDDLSRFEKLYQLLHEQKRATTYGVYNQKEELLASCVFFFSHKRAYYILVGNHPNGRTLGASHQLIDAFISDYAGEDLLLDFEGSDIRNLAFFYSSFGAREENYAAIKMNRLPWYAKWLKE
jgi:hypothetical protein